MLYSAMYCAASAPASLIAWFTSAGTRLEKRSRQPRLRPLAPRPRLCPRLSRSSSVVSGKLSSTTKASLFCEEVVDDVRRRVVAGQDLVERIDRPEVEVRLPAEVAGDLVHVPVERLEHELHPVEERVERRRIAGEVRPHDSSSNAVCVAVLGAPEPGGLLDAALDARALGFAVLWASSFSRPVIVCFMASDGPPSATRPSVALPRARP